MATTWIDSDNLEEDGKIKHNIRKIKDEIEMWKSSKKFADDKMTELQTKLDRLLTTPDQP